MPQKCYCVLVAAMLRWKSITAMESETSKVQIARTLYVTCSFVTFEICLS